MPNFFVVCDAHRSRGGASKLSPWQAASMQFGTASRRTQALFETVFLSCVRRVEHLRLQ